MNEYPDELVSAVAAKLVIKLRTIDTLTPLHDKDALVQEFKNKSRLFTSQYLKRCFFSDTPGGEQEGNDLDRDISAGYHPKMTASPDPTIDASVNELLASECAKITKSHNNQTTDPSFSPDSAAGCSPGSSFVESLSSQKAPSTSQPPTAPHNPDSAAGTSPSHHSSNPETIPSLKKLTKPSTTTQTVKHTPALPPSVGFPRICSSCGNQQSSYAYPALRIITTCLN